MKKEITDMPRENRHTKEIQDILDKEPSWILGWSSGFYLLIIVAIAGLTSIIKYSDVVKVPIKLIAIDADQTFYGQIVLSSSLRTNINSGQIVNVRMTNCSKSTELQGRISYISDSTSIRKIYLRIDFQKQFQPRIRQYIYIKPGTLAYADIMIRNASLFHHISSNLISMIKNK